MIYLYAITEELDGCIEALRGIDHALLTYLSRDGLVAVVSSIEGETVSPTPRRLWQHEQVVEALMTKGAVLPARFSTVFESEDVVEEKMSAFCEEYQVALNRLRNCVELNLRVVRLMESSLGGDGQASDEAPELSETTLRGRTASVAQKAVQEQHRTRKFSDESLGKALHQSLAECAVEHRLSLEDSRSMLMKSAYLVRNTRLDEIKEKVRELIEMHSNLHFLCTGPWPPYHFVEPITSALPGSC
ncbi:MAG: GvpL/GvpF family gas vesicle protein [Rhodothermales bacterium]